MSNQLIQLQRLEIELHAVNQELAQAARPLEHLSEVNDSQRQQVADQLRALLARWESVTHEIQQVMGIGNADSQATSNCNEGGAR